LASPHSGCSCPPNALRISRAAPIDRDRFHVMIPRKIGPISLAGTASGCMRWLGGTTPEGRADLPTVLAPEGAAWHVVRGRSFATRLDATTVAGVPRDGIRGSCRRFRSHQDSGRMHCSGMPPEGVPCDGLSRQGMRSLRWRSDARFARVGDQAAAMTGAESWRWLLRIEAACARPTCCASVAPHR
jgi:hypothetical protein